MMYIYGLQDPETKRVRYVGVSNNPQRRFKAHLKPESAKFSHKDNWITSLKKRGLLPTLFIIQEVADDSWGLVEQQWIKHYRLNGEPLTNLANGGQGATGYHHTEEAKKRMSATRKGKPHNHKGWIWTPESRKKLSLSSLGKIMSKEARLKMSQAAKGKSKGHPSKETRRKMSIAQMGNKKFLGKRHSEETKQKIRTALLGHSISEETRRKIGIANSLTKRLKNLLGATGEKWTSNQQP
jgi:group I intron endonuclease